MHHALWLTGWTLLAGTLMRAGNGFVSGFALQMFTTGVVAVVLCPLSGRRVQDTVHWVSALIYMIDHVVMLALLGTTKPFVRGFWGCFATMSLCSQLEKRARANDAAQGFVRAAEYGFMLGEYGLFIFFLSGMLSGLR